MVDSAAMRSVLAIALLFAGAISSTGCPQEESPRVTGSEARERWIVTFAGAEPDLAEYRGLIKDQPAEAGAYVDKMRRKLDQDHAEIAKTIEAMNGQIVERWWMTNSMTVELEAGSVPTLQQASGVKSVATDVSLP